MRNKIGYTSEPNPNISIEEKLKPTYGVKMARHIYTEHRDFNSDIFSSRSEDYREMLAYYQGDQSVDRYKKIFDLHRNQDNSWLNIDWRIHNYATKRINIVIDMLVDEVYRPRLDAVDSIAIDRKEELEARTKSAHLLSGIREQLGLMAETIPELGSKTFKSMDDIEIFFDKDYKDLFAMEAEMGIEHFMEVNNWSQIQKDIALWLSVTGVGGTRTNLSSSSGLPKIEFLSPERLVVPKVEHEDFRDLKKIGYIRDLALSTLKIEVGKQIDEFKLKKIYNEHGTDSYEIESNSDRYSDYSGKNGDGKRVRVMDFSYVTSVSNVYERKINKLGQSVLYKTKHTKGKGSTYKTKKNEYGVSYRTNGSNEVYKEEYEIVISGVWIVGSEEVYDYKVEWNQDRDRKNESKVHLNYHLVAPNLMGGKVVSLMEQILPTLDDIQNYQLKINQHIASAVPKGAYINLDALENANFTSNGKQMDSRELLRLFFERGIVVGRDSDISGLNGNSVPVREIENGVAKDLIVMLQMIQHKIKELDEIIGLPEIMAASNPHPDTGAKVSQMVAKQTNHALGHLRRGIRSVYSRTAKSTLRHYQELVERGKGVKISAALGQSSIDFMKEHSQVHLCDFGFKLEILPDATEWQELYMDMKEAWKTGQLDIGDYYYVRNIDNLKQAQAMFEMKSKKRAEEAAEANQANIEQNASVQQKSAEFAAQMEIQKATAIEAEKRITLEVEYDLKMKLAMLEREADAKFKTDQTLLEGNVVNHQIEKRGNNDIKRDIYKNSKG